MKDDLVLMIVKLLKFPQPAICRHAVVLDIVSMLEKNGEKIPLEFVMAISSGSEGDEDALSYIHGSQISINK